MALGTSPYNFVPLNEHIYFPEWANQISMDIPFEDGEDGVIEVEWTNDSPLFIRDVQNPDDKNGQENQYSMHIMQPDGTRLYFLPGSSLRGMLRSVLCILSFGKMDETQYNNTLFGYRDIPNKEYRAKMDNIRYGWLIKDGEEYRLYTRDNEYWKEHNLKNLARRIDGTYGDEKRRIEQNALAININDLDKLYPGYKKSQETSAWKQNEFLKDNSQDKQLFPFYRKDGEVFNIFATGYMNGKNHEILIPALRNDDKVMKLDTKTVEKFKSVYAPTPDFNEFWNLLEQNEKEQNKKIPVSYIMGSNNKVEAIGMGRMIRFPYKYDIKHLVENQQKSNDNKNKIDLCEAIFGWVGKDGENSCMKGRVQVGNAFTQTNITDTELREIRGVLGTPKASYYPFYIKQNGTKLLTFDDENAIISGRKWYRIHKGKSTMPLPKNEENPNVEIQFKAIPAGHKFNMRINVHNLKKVEVGALISAITLHNQKDVWHNIGLAKSFGFGKLSCTSIKLRGFSFEEHDYLVAFEREMEQFASQEYKRTWIRSVQTTTLFSIMSEHDDTEVKMMEMEKEIEENKKQNEYEETKKKPNTAPLNETSFPMQSIITEEDKLKEFRVQHRADYEKIEKLECSEDKTDLNTAINKLNQLISKCEQDNLPTQADEEWKARIEERLKIIKKKERETKANRPLDDEIKSAKDVKVVVQRCEKWMKTHNMDDISKASFISNLKRVKNIDEKKFQKQWNQKYINGVISEILTPEEIDSVLTSE